jgi:hypothetical protein
VRVPDPAHVVVARNIGQRGDVRVSSKQTVVMNDGQVKQHTERREQGGG